MSQARLSVSRYTTTDGVHVVALAGDIDHTTAGTFHQALTAPDDSAPRAVVDFRNVTFMDSSGINVLVAANNTARSCGGWLRLARTPAPGARPAAHRRPRRHPPAVPHSRGRPRAPTRRLSGSRPYLRCPIPPR